jgi:hypothetical protein
MTDKVRDFHWRKPDRIKQPDEGSDDFSLAVQDMAIKLFARTGEHCLTLRLILGTKACPADVQARCDRERAAYLADSDAWWLRVQGGEP